MTHSLDVLSGFAPAVPAGVVERAVAYAAVGQPVESVLAASVVLLRDTPGAVETYLLHRHARMPFAASMAVFPGGRVDPADGPGGPEALLACACRETAEETGVVLDSRRLHRWAHWVTPEFEPRRYDTSFYVAALPLGAVAADVSGETDFAEWVTPRNALTAFDRGEIALMPPTQSILIELAAATSVGEVLHWADGRVVARVQPELRHTATGWSFCYPRRAP